MAVTNYYVRPGKLTKTACSITYSTTTATVTAAGHGYSNSDVVKIHGCSGADGDLYNGNFTISNVTTDTFDYTMAGTPTANAAGDPRCSKLNLSGDDGTTHATGYADLQYLFDNFTDPGGKVQFNVCSEAELPLSGVCTMPTGSNVDDRFTLAGYGATPNDGGFADINCQGRYYVTTPEADYSFVRLRVHNGGQAGFALIDAGYGDSGIIVLECELFDSDDSAFSFSNGTDYVCCGCYIHDVAGIGIEGIDYGNFFNNFFKNGSVKKFTECIKTQTQSTISGNFAYLDGSSSFVNQGATNSDGCLIKDNSIYSNAGTGSGINVSNPAVSRSQVVNNLVEGFSGTGGIGIDDNTDNEANVCAYNTVYNCATAFGAGVSGGDGSILPFGNESAGASLFAKGTLPADSLFESDNAAFWSAVRSYFEPQDVGSVVGGGFAGSTRGATWAASGGGGTTVIVIED